VWDVARGEAAWDVKADPRAQAAKPERIISDKEVNRGVRFEVALIKWKRKKLKRSVEKCAESVGISPKGWRKVEHRKTSPTAKNRLRMMVAVEMTLADIIFAMQRRKTGHLWRITGSELLFQL
jgi:hypothetical protein